jgi:serine/threonine protein kinase
LNGQASLVELDKISQENLINYIFSFTEGRSAYIGYKLMEGGSLGQILKTRFPNGFKDVNLIVTILKSLLNGIEYLHLNNLFHR